MKTKKKPAGIAATNEIRNEMAVAEIVHAPWNPRTEAELKPDHPAMVELIESVKALGVVQPIAVWTGAAAAEIAGGGRKALCIAGNRRLEAAKAVGLKTIPVHQFTDLTEEEARAITRAENECRFGVSPLADAQLVKSMMDIGRSQSEFAALVGVSEATVCRRAKLLDLSKDVVKAIGSENLDAKSLEKIAAYPEDLQKKAAVKSVLSFDGSHFYDAISFSFANSPNKSIASRRMQPRSFQGRGTLSQLFLGKQKIAIKNVAACYSWKIFDER